MGSGSLRVTTTLGLRADIEEREKGRVRTPVNGSGSRARPGGEGKGPPRRGAFAWAPLLAIAAFVGACSPQGSQTAALAGAEEANVRRATPSGLPVPRYVSLKFGEVNARGGPGDDYRLLWTYRARGLPLQVVAETTDWRRICDPEGATAWVHQRTVDPRRMVMRTAAEDLDMRRSPAADSPLTARLAGRAIAALETCRDGWCRVAAGRTRGWIPEDQVWGTAQSPQCPAPAPTVGG